MAFQKIMKYVGLTIKNFHFHLSDIKLCYSIINQEPIPCLKMGVNISMATSKTVLAAAGNGSLYINF
jgi:hypothetical protein